MKCIYKQTVNETKNKANTRQLNAENTWLLFHLQSWIWPSVSLFSSTTTFTVLLQLLAS